MTHYAKHAVLVLNNKICIIDSHTGKNINSFAKRRLIINYIIKPDSNKVQRYQIAFYMMQLLFWAEPVFWIETGLVNVDDRNFGSF
ncbi:hypothetical protein HYN43_004240 [Mucilaginibacter celer]|uniref:Uncharacterized protein n=1 Tax=Mucilaginibacter celer TaxID=2305508 RepID=A0A494VI85_9SPHI|nr:hypothetical protein HYN43_004240 [Mucilaginibacter celer]